MKKLLFVDAFKARWLKKLAPVAKKLFGLDLGALMDMAFEKNLQRGIPLSSVTRIRLIPLTQVPLHIVCERFGRRANRTC